MKIKGKIHCFFEQSGTFKNEFKKLGYEAYDYDIQNNFNQTDFVIDLFAEIEKGYNVESSIFDMITKDDLILAFFPCIYFCDSNTLYFQGDHLNLKNQFKENDYEKFVYLKQRSEKRQYFYGLLWQLLAICSKNNTRLIIENPWDSNGLSYLQRNFIKPSYIDKDRTRRGDFYKKPTAFWFLNCKHSECFTFQQTSKQKTKTIKKSKSSREGGLCSEERSMISPDYARNFICDNILGITQRLPNQQLTLF